MNIEEARLLLSGLLKFGDAEQISEIIYEARRVVSRERESTKNHFSY